MIECSINHCEICFDALLSAFKKLPHVPESSVETYDVPMFVTLKKTDGLRQTLRGCIGSLSPRPITDLGEYAKKSAFEDRRFSPLQIHELPFIELSVSLLIDYQDGRREEIEKIYESEVDYKYASTTEIVNAFEEGLEDITSYKDRLDKFIDDDEEEEIDSMRENM